jgi:hypothetical protein
MIYINHLQLFESTGKSRYRIDAEYSTYSTVPTR